MFSFRCLVLISYWKYLISWIYGSGVQTEQRCRYRFDSISVHWFWFLELWVWLRKPRLSGQAMLTNSCVLRIWAYKENEGKDMHTQSGITVDWIGTYMPSLCVVTYFSSSRFWHKSVWAHIAIHAKRSWKSKLLWKSFINASPSLPPIKNNPKCV